MLGNTPPGGNGQVRRNPANEETAILTPVTDHTSALDRIPLSQKKRWIILCSALGAIALASLATTIYMVNVTNDWERRANDLSEINYEIGDDLRVEQEVVISQQQQIDLLNDQLDNSKQQVLDLVNAANQTDDAVAVAQQQVDNLRDLLVTASAVGNAMNRCIDGHEQLVIYIRNSGDYDPEELATYEADLERLCTAAQDANAQFQRTLTP